MHTALGGFPAGFSNTAEAQATEEQLESLIERKVNLIAVAAGCSDMCSCVGLRLWWFARCLCIEAGHMLDVNL